MPSKTILIICVITGLTPVISLKLLKTLKFSQTLTSVDSFRKNLLSEEGFESAPEVREGQVYPIWYDSFKGEFHKSYSFAAATSLKRTGNKAARLEIRKADTDVRRAEFIQNYTSTGRNRWYGLSLYQPSANWADSKDWEIITQFWSKPDAGESNHTPPISLSVSNGRYRLVVRWEASAIHTNETVDGTKTFDLGPVEKDKWLDFVYHINFSYKSDGVLEVWKDGKKVVDYRGPNSYNDKTVPYFKFGMYKYSWESHYSNRVLYVDEVRIGNENATYNDVAPLRTIFSTELQYQKLN
nr:polysaccharide lyase [Pontibacter vulgaris]